MGDIKQLRPMTQLNSGDVLQSRYRILHSLGRGGFSRTYLAEDLNRFNELCVLKEFAPQLKEAFALKGGINELPLKVQIINDDNDPELAKKIVKNLSEKPEILSEFITAVFLGGGEVTNIFDLSNANFNASDRSLQAVIQKHVKKT